jgi:hypothetical protein
MDRKPFVICSYYTLGTPYQGVAHEYLMKSVKNLPKEVRTDIRGVPDLGSWQRNTGYKAEFVRNMLEHHTENVVFLDCDAEILQYPELFETIPDEYNFACHTLDRNKWYGTEFHESQTKELLSGTLFIRNNKESRVIVQEWAMTCCISPQIWEQVILGMVLKKNNIPVYDLPISYCYIKTLPDGREPLVKCDSPVIIHNQVSRKLRNRVKV